MQFKQGSQSLRSIWVAVFWFSAGIVSHGDSLSVAQESSVQDGYMIESFSAEGALATSEADGHSFVKQPLIATPEFGLNELLYTIVVVEVPTENARPIVRELVLEKNVPMIGRIPYVGKLFKKTVKATESISTILLIRCQKHTTGRP